MAGSLEDSPLLVLAAAAACGCPVSKSMVDQFSRGCSRLPKSRLRGRANHEVDGGGTLERARFKLYEGLEELWSPPVRRFRSAIRSVPREDDRRTPVVAGGLLRTPGAVGGLDPGAPIDAAFSNAVVPRTARLNDCEFRDNAPRALLRSSSREILAPGAATPLSVRSSETKTSTR
jgi:hypothetical protein